MLQMTLLALIVTVPTTPEKAPGAPHGKLAINAHPYAKVYINGGFVGQTPLLMKHPVGRVRITLTRDGESVRFVKKVLANKTSKIMHRFGDVEPATPRFEATATMPRWAAAAVRNPEPLEGRLESLRQSERMEDALAIASAIALRAEALEDAEKIRAELDELMRFSQTEKLLQIYERLRLAEGAPPAGRSGECRSFGHLPRGYITLNSKPYSFVRVDGEEVGQTPIARLKLAAGCHQIEAQTKDGRTKKFRVRIEPNTTVIFDFAIR